MYVNLFKFSSRSIRNHIKLMTSNASPACARARYSLLDLHKYNIASRTRSFRRASPLFSSRRKPVYRKKRLPSIPRRRPSLHRVERPKFRSVEILFITSPKIALRGIWPDQSAKARRLPLAPVGTWRQLIASYTVFPSLARCQSCFTSSIDLVFIPNVQQNWTATKRFLSGFESHLS